MLTTPLLKCQLEKCLKVTQIYHVIEYHAKASFTKTGNVISEARSEGGCDDNCATKSETMYLIGYKAYDKALTNKAKHVDVPYVRSKVTPKLVNNPCLKKID